MGQDNFPIAAMRHFTDASFLRDIGRADNAVCHYAFSAECFIKTFYEVICQADGVNLKHKVENAYVDLVEMYSIVRMMDVRTDILFGQMQLPPKLFDNHPFRRYMKDIVYTDEEMNEIHNFIQKLMEELVLQAIDGRLKVE